MSDIMRPIPFGSLMNWILAERKQKGQVFGVARPFVMTGEKTLSLFGEKLETPFGPAAGPHTQLSQNIIAAYYAGSRFFELKTVQTLDGEDLPVAKPCIDEMCIRDSSCTVPVTRTLYFSFNRPRSFMIFAP